MRGIYTSYYYYQTRVFFLPANARTPLDPAAHMYVVCVDMCVHEIFVSSPITNISTTAPYRAHRIRLYNNARLYV